MQQSKHLATSSQQWPLDTAAWLCALVSFDTTSRHSNLELIEYVASYCESLGLSPRLTYDQTKSKANLFVTVAAGTHQDIYSGGTVLSGHTDVVPVDGQDWHSDPFNARITADRIYGRGTCDMKGFIACVLHSLPQVVAAANQGLLKKPWHVALTYDEEVGCLGAPRLLEDLLNQKIQPEYCIVGEPTMMRMVTAHKGISVYRCSVHGHSVHSSLTPQGVNAISYAAELICDINKIAQTLAHQSQDHDFDVPFATLSMGTIKGGTATNIVPELCSFTFDHRNLPHTNPDKLLKPIQARIEALNARMQAVHPDAHITLTQLESVPPMGDADAKALAKMLAALVDDPKPQKVAYATEGGQFTQAGIATVICGPGSIDQAHKPNEFVSLSQLQRCDRFLADLLTRLC